eukprot:scaffold27591_cov97-Isochrysis_galbana.AAC.2
MGTRGWSLEALGRTPDGGGWSGGWVPVAAQGAKRRGVRCWVLGVVLDWTPKSGTGGGSKTYAATDNRAPIYPYRHAMSHARPEPQGDWGLGWGRHST